MIPTEIDYARLAALIDGEGCIGIGKYQYRAKHSPRYTVRCSIYNTDVRMVMWVRDLFGGKLRGRHRQKNTKPCYEWHQEGPALTAILEKCLPYFLIKRTQAEHLIELQKLQKRRGGRNPMLKVTPPDILTKKEALYRGLQTVKELTGFVMTPKQLTEGKIAEGGIAFLRDYLNGAVL
jgi:hypothetical protein